MQINTSFEFKKVAMAVLMAGTVTLAFAANKTSTCTGTGWNTSTCWSPAAGVPASNDNVTINTALTLDKHLTGGSGVSGALTVNASMSLTGSAYNMEIKNGGNLETYGNMDVNNLDFANGSSVWIHAGSTVTVWGDFTNQNNSNDVIVDGTLIIKGSASNGTGATITGAGTIEPQGGAFSGGGSIDPGVSVLPVELLSFSATTNSNGTVLIAWVTVSEINNDYFTAERTIDGTHFVPVATVKGAGNSNKPVNYSAIDNAPVNGTSYYRLKQTDFNGQFEIFDMVPVQVSNESFSVGVFPNPATAENLNFSLAGTEPNEEILVVLVDLLGKEYYSKLVVAENDNHTFAVDQGSNLSSGTYMVIASSNDKYFSKKVVIR